MSARHARRLGRSVEALEACGYEVVRIGPPFDLAGFSTTDVVLVRVVFGAWPEAAEVEQLGAFPAPPNVRRLVHRYRPRVRRPGVREVGP